MKWCCQPIPKRKWLFGYNYDKRYGIDVIGAYQGSHKFVRDTNSVSSLQYLPDGLFLTNLSGKMQKK